MAMVAQQSLHTLVSNGFVLTASSYSAQFELGSCSMTSMGVSVFQLSMSTVTNLAAAAATQMTMSDKLTVKFMVSISSSLLLNHENHRGGWVGGAAVAGGCSTRAVSSALIAASAVCASVATASVDVLAASRRVPGPRDFDFDAVSPGLLCGWLDACKTKRCGRACGRHRVNRRGARKGLTGVDADIVCSKEQGLRGLRVITGADNTAWQLRWDCTHAPTPPPRWWCGGAGCMMIKVNI